MTDALAGNMTIEERHQIHLESTALIDVLKDPILLGLTEADFIGMSDKQRNTLIAGEYFAVVCRCAGKLSSRLLMEARWGYAQPEWYDHRNHLLDPEANFNDFWTMLADISISKMPIGARVLSLCSGDGFYEYYFYRHRASEITSIELDPATHRHAVRLHSAQNIKHVNASILEYAFPENYYDTVTIRGAIEHFSEENQQALFRKVQATLKPGGWFCGDTPANPDKNHRMLNSHEYEWADEEEMRRVLTKVFQKTDSSILVSKERTTLLWQCMKVA